MAVMRASSRLKPVLHSYRVPAVGLALAGKQLILIF